MKIRYKETYLHSSLQGLVSLLILFIIKILIINIYHSQPISINDLASLIMPLFFLVVYYYSNKHQYLTIENGYITQNQLWGKKILLKELTEIKNDTPIYTLRTNSKSIKIYTKIIELESLRELDSLLRKISFKNKL